MKVKAGRKVVVKLRGAMPMSEARDLGPKATSMGVSAEFNCLHERLWCERGDVSAPARVK